MRVRAGSQSCLWLERDPAIRSSCNGSCPPDRTQQPSVPRYFGSLLSQPSQTRLILKYVQSNPELGNVRKGNFVFNSAHTSSSRPRTTTLPFLFVLGYAVLISICATGNGGDRRWLGYSRSDLLLFLLIGATECRFSAQEWACSTMARTFLSTPARFQQAHEKVGSSLPLPHSPSRR